MIYVDNFLAICKVTKLLLYFPGRRGKGTRKGKQVIKQVMKAGGAKEPQEQAGHEDRQSRAP